MHVKLLKNIFDYVITNQSIYIGRSNTGVIKEFIKWKTVSGNETLDVSKLNGDFLYINGYFFEPLNSTTSFLKLASSQQIIAEKTGLSLLVNTASTLISSKLKIFHLLFLHSKQCFFKLMVKVLMQSQDYCLDIMIVFSSPMAL